MRSRSPPALVELSAEILGDTHFKSTPVNGLISSDFHARLHLSRDSRETFRQAPLGIEFKICVRTHKDPRHDLISARNLISPGSGRSLVS